MSKTDKERQAKVSAAVDKLLESLPDDLEKLEPRERTTLLKELLPYAMKKKEKQDDDGNPWGVE